MANQEQRENDRRFLVIARALSVRGFRATIQVIDAVGVRHQLDAAYQTTLCGSRYSGAVEFTYPTCLWCVVLGGP